MGTRGFVILAACLALTMAVPAQDRAVQTVTDGINQFSSAFYREVSKSHPGNLVTSPLSASVALSMVGYGAREETEKEFKSVLHLPEEFVARTGYAKFIDSFNTAEKIELNLANKVFVNEHFSVKPTFHELLQTAFRSASEKVNFGNPKAAADKINKWVQEETNDRIKDIVNPDKLGPDTSMVLINTLYFKGNWLHKFNKHETRARPFHLTKSQVKNVPTMHKLGRYTYGVFPELKAKYIELPYEDENLSMIIVLPDSIHGLTEVERKLAGQDLSQLLKTKRHALVSLSLPKFKIESSLDLNKHLQNLGLTKAFNKHEANFLGISDRAVYISSVLQKTFIDVNEQGTEAAAATAITVVPISGVLNPEKPVDFTVDHPFFYSIIHTAGEGKDRTVTSLFQGHIADPKF